MQQLLLLSQLFAALSQLLRNTQVKIDHHKTCKYVFIEGHRVFFFLLRGTYFRIAKKTDANNHISWYPKKHGAELEIPHLLEAYKTQSNEGTGEQRTSFFFFMVAYSDYKYAMRLKTQRISGHMLQSALEYTKSSASHCLQAIYHLKQDKKQQFEKKEKHRIWSGKGLAQNHYLFSSLPYHLSPPAAPTYLQGCPDFPSGHRSASPDEVFITASPGVFPPVHGGLNQFFGLLYPAVSIPCSPPIPAYSCIRTYSPTHCFHIHSIN